jgi:replicative DNA helicase
MDKDRLYDLSTERTILKKLIIDKPFLHSAYLYKKVVLDHFADLFHRDVFTSIMKFYRKYGNLPPKKHLQLLVIKHMTLQPGKFKKEDQQKIWKKSIDRLFMPATAAEDDSIKADLSNLDEMRKARLLQSSLIESSKFFEDGDYDRAFSLMTKKAMESTLVERSITEGNIVADYPDHLKMMEQQEKGFIKPFLSNIQGVEFREKSNKEPDDVKLIKKIDMDDYVSFNKGEMTLLVGENNIGKSFFLMEMCYSIARKKVNVVLFTIEMNKNKQQNRIYSRLTNIPYLKFKNAELSDTDKEKWGRRVEEWKEKCGILHVVSFDQGATVPDIEHKLDDIENNYGESFDVIAIDYLNDMKPIGSYSGGDRDWAAYGEISKALDNLSKYYHDHEGITVITANQKKSSSKQPDIKWQDAAFSPLPSQHATIGIGLYQAGTDAISASSSSGRIR